MSIVSTEYKPTYDYDKGVYVDILPFTHNSRGNITKWCPCRVIKCQFNTNTTFKNHIKTRQHKEWLNHLDQPSIQDKEIRHLKKNIIALEKDNARYSNNYNKLLLEYKNLKIEYEKIYNIIHNNLTTSTTNINNDKNNTYNNEST
tara:strand:+ start:495 stop:929 length:435 start_codon:yes stop_codon:yes gene_type:complete